jgi:DNA invertase Pin-like site-specific DNA recombinase
MKAIIYARVSSTTDRQSTDRQVADLRNYASYANMKVTRVFEEHISGAKKNSERPVLGEALEYSRAHNIDMLLVSELSRLGRNAFEVLEVVKGLSDNGINLYMQKEKFTLLDDDKQPSMFAPVMLATLSTCAALERENIKFRLNSGRALYIKNGGKLGRRAGSTKSIEKKKEEYKEVIKNLKSGIPIRKIAILTGTSASTIMRLKKDLKL